MYKVFINENGLNFIEEPENKEGQTPQTDPTTEQFLQLFNQMNQNHVGQLNIGIHHMEESWANFSSLFTIIEAAGGIVVNPKGEVLFIHRLDKWDLPKGKIEDNESIEEAAAREVEEECGLEGVIVKDFLKHTYHTYLLNGKRILKKTHWFMMLHSGEGSLTPQIEEDITKVVWKSPENWKEVFENTYPSIKYLLDPNGIWNK